MLYNIKKIKNKFVNTKKRRKFVNINLTKKIMETAYKKIDKILRSANVKNIKGIIYQLSYSNMDLITMSLIDMVAKNSNDFTKDIAKKVQNGLTMSEKQAWCLAYQIVNNIEVYLSANQEEEEAEIENEPINVQALEALETDEAEQFQFEIIDTITMESIIKVESFEKGIELMNKMPNKKDLFVSEIEGD